MDVRIMDLYEQLFRRDIMTINNTMQPIYENRNAELLIADIWNKNPNISFNILGDEITEREALLLYEAVQESSMDQREVVYVPSLVA